MLRVAQKLLEGVESFLYPEERSFIDVLGDLAGSAIAGRHDDGVVVRRGDGSQLWLDLPGKELVKGAKAGVEVRTYPSRIGEKSICRSASGLRKPVGPVWRQSSDLGDESSRHHSFRMLEVLVYALVAEHLHRLGAESEIPEERVEGAGAGEGPSELRGRLRRYHPSS